MMQKLCAWRRVMLASCAQPQLTQLEDIGQVRTKEIALADASIDEQDTTRLHIASERDAGQSIYEASFAVDDFKYEYDIDASSSMIINAERTAIPEQSANANRSAASQQRQESPGEALPHRVRRHRQRMPPRSRR